MIVTQKQYRLVVKHRKDCYARRFPWVLPETVFGSKSGVIGIRGYTPWLRYRCNDISCPAVLLVLEEAVARFVETLITP